MSVAAILVLGFFLGMRHATDADHVVAVSTIVSRKQTLRAAAPVGILWGIGHSATILLVGGAIILFGLVISPRLGLGMELSVAAMLVVLGALNLRGVLRDARALASEPVAADAAAQRAQSLRPLLVGVVHGMAGSAAVALLVLGTIRDPLWACAYLVVFGIGTVGGMVLITTALALPVVFTARRFAGLQRSIVIVSSVLSVGLGVVLAYQIGFVNGLFTGR